MLCARGYLLGNLFNNVCQFLAKKYEKKFQQFKFLSKLFLKVVFNFSIINAIIIGDFSKKKYHYCNLLYFLRYGEKMGVGLLKTP